MCKKKVTVNINTILKKSWGMLWQYRGLWLFSADLVLLSANIIYSIAWLGNEEEKSWTTIRTTDGMNIRVPGLEITIDLTWLGAGKHTMEVMS